MLHLHEVLAGAYRNYMHTVDAALPTCGGSGGGTHRVLPPTDHRLLCLLDAALDCLRTLLACATPTDIDAVAAELLVYVRALLPWRTHTALMCAVQLLATLNGGWVLPPSCDDNTAGPSSSLSALLEDEVILFGKRQQQYVGDVSFVQMNVTR
jgi:hypothetical protein